MLRLDAYSVSQYPVARVCKSSCIWGHSGNTSLPLVYLRKPQWLSDESFHEIVSFIKLELPRRGVVLLEKPSGR